MEEKDIKIIKEEIKEMKKGKGVYYLYWDETFEDRVNIAKAIERLLQAYKQDEKIIQEMAENIYGSDTIFCLPKDVNSKQEVIDYFRKRCNNE